MRSLLLLSCSVLSLAVTGCAPSPPPGPPGGTDGGTTDAGTGPGTHFTLTPSNTAGANVNLLTYTTISVTGTYTGALGDSMSVIQSAAPITATNGCRVVLVFLVGKPEAGKRWELVPGESDGGIVATMGRGTVHYEEACGDKRQWLSASGIVQVDSVTDPDPRLLPVNYPFRDSTKTVSFTVTDAKMAASPTYPATTGTFTFNGEGLIELWSGMADP